MVSKPWLSLPKQLLLNTNNEKYNTIKALVINQRFFFELIARIYCLICGITIYFL
jgi:hypothetical protein